MEKGRNLSLALAKNVEDDIKYILSFDDEDVRNGMASDVQRDLTVINILSNVAQQGGDKKTSDELSKTFQALAQTVSTKINPQAFQQQQ
jgi:hypothetical protein